MYEIESSRTKADIVAARLRSFRYQSHTPVPKKAAPDAEKATAFY
jgi:hypothetical protein